MVNNSARLAAALMVVLFLCLPARLHAFGISTVGGKVVKWGIDDVGYYGDSNGWAGISNGSDKQAIVKSFNDWQGVACSFLKFHKLGDTTVGDVLTTGAQPNDKNELIWKEGYWPFGKSVLGVTSPLFNFGGKIIEADIAFNGTIGWNTNGSFWSSMDVKSVAIHEIGHFFGLQHNLQFNENDPPTMAPAVDPYGKSASLHQDDKNGICFLYPATAYTCSSSSQCPYVVDDNAQGKEYYASHFQCQGGACVPDSGPVQPGQGELGATCGGDADCKSPTFCLKTGDGNWCTQWCDAQAQDCPAGFGCYVVEGSDDGVCASIASSVDFGGYCFSDLECKSGLFCLEWWSGPLCTKECSDVDGGTGCPAAYTCYPSPQAPGGLGACIPGSVNKKDTGQACSISSECKSGMCFPSPGTTAKYCREKCEPGSTTCPGGTKCVGLPGDMTGLKGGCLPFSILPEKADGASCEGNWQCASSYCYFDAEVGKATCRRLCDLGADDCPEGTACLEVGPDQGACLPAIEPQPEGSACLHHHECTTGFCVLLPGTQKKFCRNACTTGSGCKTGFQCVFSDDPEVGACMPLGKATGEACSSSVECTTQVCWAESGPTVCLDPCVTGQCNAGFECSMFTPYGPVCLPVAGIFEVGISCTTDSQCRSGICLNSLCRAGCDLLSPSCPADQGCVPIQNTTAGACVTTGGLADSASCSNDFECQSLLCVEAQGHARACWAPCAPGQPCAPERECLAVSEMDGVGACVPVEPVVEEPEDAGTQQPEAETEEPGTQTDAPVGSSSGCTSGPSPGRPAGLLLLLLSFGLLALGRTRKKQVEYPH